MGSKTDSFIMHRLTERQKVFLVLLLALIQGSIHFFLLPPWQHYDEPTHFEYAWLIANHQELPEEHTIDHHMRHEVATSMMKYDFFWNLTPPDLLNKEQTIWIGISELGHPPGYYLLSSIPLYFTQDLDVTIQLYTARAISLLMFLAIIGVTIGLVRDIVPPKHPLGWLIPLTVLLLPPFASHMTAVNNDVAAVLIFSLFLWGSVRLIRYGLSWGRLLWVVMAACFTVMIKNTAAIALVMLPVALILTICRQYKWSWYRVASGVMALIVLSLILVLDTGDAAYWYRDELHQPQVSMTQGDSLISPGESALMLEVNPADSLRKWLNPLLPHQVNQIKGQTVTVGGWLWADDPIQISSPGLFISLKGEKTLHRLKQVIEISTTPTFFAHTYQIPDETEVAYYAFWGENLSGKNEPFQVYLDDAFLVVGDHSDISTTLSQTAPLPSAIEKNNLVRNPSGEQTWLRLRPWVHSLMAPLLRRSPSYIFNALEDVQRSKPILFDRVGPFLLYDFFAAFAWGHVRFGVEWISFFKLLVAIVSIGSLKWIIEHIKQSRESQYPQLFFLMLTALAVWAATLLWPLPYQWAKMPLPSGRYLYTSIIPIAFILAGGWWALWPKRYRRIGILLWITLLLGLNVASINIIYSFYESLPVS